MSRSFFGNLVSVDAKADAIELLANNIGALAMAINRLAATQEKSENRGAISVGIAHYEYKKDAQTEELKRIERERSGDSGKVE